MKPDAFKNHIEKAHKQWLCDNLLLCANHQWVDLHTSMFGGDEIYFELKCRLRRRKNESWCVREDQINEYREVYGDDNVYWMFLIYTLDREIVSIKNFVGKKIVSRDLFILPWQFVDRYPIYEAKHAYPREADFPKMKGTWINGTLIRYPDRRIKKFLDTVKEIPF